jgi:hypothetical protein
MDNESEIQASMRGGINALCVLCRFNESKNSESTTIKLTENMNHGEQRALQSS